MEFTKESLELLQQTATKAAGARVIEAGALGPNKCVLTWAGGYEIIDRTVPRNHALESLESVINWTAYSIQTLGYKPVIWVNESSIKIVIDDAPSDAFTASRADVSYEFTKTAEYDLLLSLAKGDLRYYDQKSWIRLLRQELWDCLDVGNRDRWIKVFKSLSSTDETKGRSSVEAGRQSLGREIDLAVSSEHGDIPETLSLNVRLFADSALEARQVVHADIESVPTSFKFALCPIKSDLTEALEAELADICAMLRARVDKSVQIFRGTHVS